MTAISDDKFTHCVVSVTRIIVPDSGAVVKHFRFWEMSLGFLNVELSGFLKLSHPLAIGPGTGNIPTLAYLALPIQLRPVGNAELVEQALGLSKALVRERDGFGRSV